MGREERPPAPVSTSTESGDLNDDDYSSAAEACLPGGERVLASLNLRHGMRGTDAVATNSLVLTESRLVYVSVGRHERSSSVVALRDVTVARIESERHGPSAYFWGVGAVIIGYVLSQVIGHQVVSIAAGLAVAAMGVFLIADKLFNPITSVVIFLSGKGEGLSCDLRGRRANADVYEFISRVYVRKEEIATGETQAGPIPEPIRRRSRYANGVSQAVGESPRSRDRG